MSMPNEAAGHGFFMTTDRIGFSHWQSGDADLARRLWGDPDVTRYICAAGVFSEEEILSRLHREMENQEKYGIQYWPVFSRDTGTLIGCCGLRPYEEGIAEIGFHLLPAFWGRGYAAEAAEAVIRYAFRIPELNGLFAGHHPENAASRKVLLKLGFTCIGEMFYAPTGLYHPSYRLLRPQK